MRKLLAWLERLVVDHRIVPLLTLGLLTALLGYAATGLKADFTPEDLFAVNPETRQAEQAFSEVFGTNDNVVVILVEAENVLEREVLEYIHDLSRRFRGQAQIDRVESLTATSFARLTENGDLFLGPVIEGEDVEPEEVSALHEVLAQSALAERRVVAPSRRVASVAVVLDSELERIDDVAEVVHRIEREVEAAPRPAGVRVSLAGLPEVRVAVVEQFWSDQSRLVPLAFLVVLAIVLVQFRWVLPAVLAGAALVVSVVLVIGGMAAVGESFNILNQVIPALVITIGLSDSVHLFNRFLQETRATGPGREAARRVLRTMAAACLMTSLTTAVGFASLLVSHNSVVRRFGVTVAIAVMVAYVVTMVLLPSVLQSVKPRRTVQAESGVLAVLTESMTGVALRRPWWVVALMGGVTAACIAAAVSVHIDTHLSTWLGEEHRLTQASRLAERDLEGSWPIEVNLSSCEEGRFDDPRVLNALHGLREWVIELPAVLAATSYADQLYEAWVAFTGDAQRRNEPFHSPAHVAALASLLEGVEPSPTAPYVTVDRRRARLSLRLRDVGASRLADLSNQILAEANARFADFPDVRISLTGDAYVLCAGVMTILEDMIGSFSTAFIVIVLFMTLLFRSVRLGLLAIPPNLVPLLAALGYMKLRGIDLDWNNAVVFAIGIGLAVDDTIHILVRFREEVRAVRDVDEALRRTARGTGRALVLTSIALAAGLLVIRSSSFLALQRFGELLLVVVVAALVADLLLTPALLKLAWPRPQAP